jgi:hypothetical protein
VAGNTRVREGRKVDAVMRERRRRMEKLCDDDLWEFGLFTVFLLVSLYSGK